MGQTLSNLTDGSGEGVGPRLGDIPESCVACVFMYLTPPEICNLARLNRAFRGAASSDSVWEFKLPPNYHDILALLPRESYRHLAKKKDIFAFLSRPVHFDDGTKAVWLNRVTGRVCISISAKAMSITGIEDRRYWTWIPTEESRFHIVAFLQQIWWFEVDGMVKFPFPAGVYSLLFRLHLGKFFKRLGRRLCSYENTHGWDLKPVRFELSTSDGQQVTRECCLDEPEKDDLYGNNKRGNWIEYHVGDFVANGTEMLVLRYSMKQIDCTHSKGGLCVDSVSIIPSELRERRKSI
ncbi:F-box protein PP2-A15 [Typha latifolia]|uniref:F-box protein PP2-A15 n=1 Tax=Typha latifolia TaxID=4733 RepID=UPI003C2D122F